MDSTCIEKNTVSGIRLIGQKYQAKLVLEPAKLLGAWRHCLHASADSRTGPEKSASSQDRGAFCQSQQKNTHMLFHNACLLNAANLLRDSEHGRSISEVCICGKSDN